MRADEWWANLADWSIPPDKRIDRDQDRTHASQALSRAATPRRAARAVADRRLHRDDDQLLRHPRRRPAIRSRTNRRSVTPGSSRALARSSSATTGRCPSSSSATSRASRADSSAIRLSKHEPVADALAEAVPRTLLLAGVALGAELRARRRSSASLQATRRGGWFDRVSSTRAARSSIRCPISGARS